MPQAPMIEVETLTKRFGATRALDEVSLSAGTGRVLALLGPNGARKTTLVRVLTTLLKPDSGCARVAGLDVWKNATTTTTDGLPSPPASAPRWNWSVTITSVPTRPSSAMRSGAASRTRH